MKLLLDTVDFLWFVSGDTQLIKRHREAIQDSSNQVFLSAISVTEIAIKHALGKLPLPSPPESYIPYCRRIHHFVVLPLFEPAALLLSKLPSHHRDPFDRLLICQALAHDLTLVSSDPLIRQYELDLL